MKRTSFFVIPAPGYYGDTATVMSAHRTAKAAWKFIGACAAYEVRAGSLAKGDPWRRVASGTYPPVPRPA